MSLKVPSNFSVHGSECVWFDCDGERQREEEEDINGELVLRRKCDLSFSWQRP